METLMTLQFPLKRDIMTTVRLVTGGICSLVGLGLDVSEDCKVCVTESLLLLIRRGYTEAKVSFRRDKTLKICLEGSEETASEEPSTEEEISVAILQALVENLQTVKENGIYRITFGFGA